MARLFGATVAPCQVAHDIAGDSTKVRNRPRRTNSCCSAVVRVSEINDVFRHLPCRFTVTSDRHGHRSMAAFHQRSPRLVRSHRADVSCSRVLCRPWLCSFQHLSAATRFLCHRFLSSFR
ncbi:hypothetical protein MRX96_007895 [Rhipicephalus microplus]